MQFVSRGSVSGVSKGKIGEFEVFGAERIGNRNYWTGKVSLLMAVFAVAVAFGMVSSAGKYESVRELMIHFLIFYLKNVVFFFLFAFVLSLPFGFLVFGN